MNKKTMNTEPFFLLRDKVVVPNCEHPRLKVAQFNQGFLYVTGFGSHDKIILNDELTIGVGAYFPIDNIKPLI